MSSVQGHLFRIVALASLAMLSSARAWAQPAAPVNLTATVLNGSAIVLYWHDDQSKVETGFEIWRKDQFADWQLLTKKAANNAGFNNNGFVDSGIDAASRRYRYRVRAYNNLGYSPYSSEAPTVALELSSGFDYPVGNEDGLGGYTSTAGTECAGWKVAYDVAYPGYAEHTGEDWNGTCGGDSDRGQPVYSASAGRVVYAGYVPWSWGNVVLIAHKLPGGQVVYSQYAHLENILVRAGDSVVRRQEVGAIGKGTGDLSAHLHFEIRKEAVPVGHWPMTAALIAARYFNPTVRTNNKSVIVDFAATGFVDAHRDLSGPILRIGGALWGSKPQGQTFAFSGSGYTPGGTVTRFLKNGTKVVELTPKLPPVDVAGNIGWSFTPPCMSLLGTYTLRVIDDSTSRSSNEVTEVITAGTCVTLYQAERASLTFPAKVAWDHVGYSGSGFVAGYGWVNGAPSVGAATTFSVFASAEGNHLVDLRYANATGSTKTLSIYVNNSRVKQTLFASLANWDTWASRAEWLYLYPGWNAVSYRYNATDSGNVNLDFIRVSR